MKTSSRLSRFTILIVGFLILGMSLPAYAADPVTPIPWGGETVLPDYIGEPAKAHPTANSRVPQNPFLGPNPFNHPHDDTWNSDVVDIAALLGRDPEVRSTTLEAAKQDPNSPLFNCGTMAFDSHGRLVLSCLGLGVARVVLVHPQTLEVLSFYPIPPPTNRLNALGFAYYFVDDQDQVTIVAYPDEIWVLREGGSATQPVLELVKTYDLSAFVPDDDNIAGNMVDWQGRIWFDTAGVGEEQAKVCVLNPATYPDVKCVPLGEDSNGKHELIRNTFALTKDGAYIVSSEKMYRLAASSEDEPYVVWSEPYKTIGTVKPGQYSLGSGTSPTILGNGKYVAITDNDDQLHVVVFRTDERLDPNEERVVCEEPVFMKFHGADENSLVGSGLSLLAENVYGYDFNFQTGAMTPNEPGFARVDIDPNGKGCRTVWTNYEAASSVCGKLSTRTGLYYTLTRKMDETKKDAMHPLGLDVYYWAALDWRTGEVVWEKMAGTGTWYDGWYPCIGIGSDETMYVGGYGGLLAISDTP